MGTTTSSHSENGNAQVEPENTQSPRQALHVLCVRLARRLARHA